MQTTAVFKRREKKYLLSPQQAEGLLPVFTTMLVEDARGEQAIRNMYYDSPAFDLIRRSIEKPLYKEKLRLRRYGQANDDTPVYIELKKKFKGVVYKRRISMPFDEAQRFLKTGYLEHPLHQVQKEVRYLCQMYSLQPAVFLGYLRRAFAGVEEGGLRITLDRQIRARACQLSLDESPDDAALIPSGCRLMEIKAQGAYPLWLANCLSKHAVYPVSFSKVGHFYQQQRGKYPAHEEGGKHAAS